MQDSLSAEAVGRRAGSAHVSSELRILFLLEQAQQGLGLGEEVYSIGRRDGRSRGELHRKGIAMGAVDAEFILVLRPGGEAGHADVTDGLALANAAARADAAREARHVTV